MVINENNSLLNSFVKGMNSDTSFDQISNELYILGLNIRITKNQLLGNSGEYSTVHEGIVTPVPELGYNYYLNIPSTESIIAVQSSSELNYDFGIILTTDSATRHNLYIYKIRVDIGDTPNAYPAKLIWKCVNVWKAPKKAPEKISTVLYKELENVIKLYIATGEHPIVSLRVDKDSENKYSYLPPIHTEDQEPDYISIDKLINNREVPTNRVFIDAVISGRLTTSQVLYTYRYYNKYGNTTQLAPLTNKIQVIDPSRTKEVGNAENTDTSIGFALKIDVKDYLKNTYERILVFRLSYIIPGQNAEVDLIYDGDIKSDGTYFNLNDVGIIPILKLSIEEFAAMSGMILIPQTIELNQEYMFCANVKDDTILKDVERVPFVEDLNWPEEYKLVQADVVLTEAQQGDIPTVGNNAYKDDYNSIKYWDTSLNRLVVDETMSILDYLEERGINKDIVKSNYNDIFTSSLLRSLRRGETYKYGIVFYDDKGRRTDVINLCDVDVLDYNTLIPFRGLGTLFAQPLGVRLKIPKLKNVGDANIIGCLVIRRSSSDVYLKTLLQVALARPVSQAMLDVNIDSGDDVLDNVTKKSPFYPTGLLSVNNMFIYPSYYNVTEEVYDPDTGEVIDRIPTTMGGFDENGLPIIIEGNQGGIDIGFHPDLAARTRNHKLYQIFSSEIDFRRNDVLSRINTSDTNIVEVYYPHAIFSKYENNIKEHTYDGTLPESMSEHPQPSVSLYTFININRLKVEKLTIDAKQSKHWIFNYYLPTANHNNSLFNGETEDGYRINHIKDVKIPEWNSGFVEVQRIGENLELLTAIKKYKSYSTRIDEFTFNNWISFCKYGLKAGTEDQANVHYGGKWWAVEMLSDPDRYSDWIDDSGSSDKETTQNESDVRMGYIGPGSSCFLLTTEKETGRFPLYSVDSNSYIYTSICNLTHNPRITDVESDEYVSYYGFGNWFNLKLKQYNQETDTYEYITDTDKDFLTVFDGDVYITPHEFATMYKAYDFNSGDTLQSTQVVNYVPLESKVNTYFDYGMNMMNTHSENLMYEPGYIDGVNTQDRPAHLYNMIYSDNDASNDVFTLISTDKNETNLFKQRAYYSDLKTNGEFIDNFLIFKAAAFIDVDSRYGEITNLLTDKNNLYYWQDNACGKFSVNERSLVNDLNNNTIMLGQAGILSRYDYLSTKYGMRLYDFCAKSVDNGGVFWVDINNRAIPAISGSGVINYSETMNVLNIVNNRIETSLSNRPCVDYDLQNDEILCKCLTNGDQLVFNVKYNIASSIYTRRYDQMLYIKNHIFGLRMVDDPNDNNDCLGMAKYNYLNTINSYLSPILLQFVVNPMASVTKVFDSQQLVPIKRDSFVWSQPMYPEGLFDSTKFSFETDIINKEFGDSMEPHTDREGNIIYSIPRYNNDLGFGNRVRGKWLRVNIKNTDPESLFTISHFITKFRQSYS